VQQHLDGAHAAGRFSQYALATLFIFGFELMNVRRVMLSLQRDGVNFGGGVLDPVDKSTLKCQKVISGERQVLAVWTTTKPVVL
jgi:hypothetical protein